MSECNVCFYDFREVTPRLLVCGHSLCELCLTALTRNDRIKCPCCRNVHQLRQGETARDLRRNFALEEVLRETTPRPKTASVEDPLTQPISVLRAVSGAALQKAAFLAAQCSQCYTAPATVMCLGCDSASLCAACLAARHCGEKEEEEEEKGERPHKTLRIAEGVLVCDEHPQHALKFFCQEEKALICSECVRIGGHAAHVYGATEGAANRVRVVLEQSVAAHRSAALKLTALRDTKLQLITKVQQDEQTTREAIAAALQGVHDALCERQAELEHQLSLRTSKEVRALEKEVEVIGEIEGKTLQLFKHVSRLLSPEQGGSDAAMLLGTRRQVESTLDQLNFELTSKDDIIGTSRKVHTVVCAGLTDLVAIDHQLTQLQIVSEAEAQELKRARSSDNKAQSHEDSDSEYDMGFSLFD